MKYYLYLLALLLALPAKAQWGKLYTADNQLSNSFVNQVFQDRDGMIWIATRNGLNSYDGYQFKHYRKEDGKSRLTSNYLICFCQDNKGNLYVGSNLTVQRFNGEYFENIRLIDTNGHATSTYITNIMQRRNGQIIIASSGYGLFAMASDGTAKGIKGLPAGITYTRRVVEDGHRRLWVATSFNGLYRLSDNRRATHYFTGKTIGNTLRDICTDNQGNLWVATFGQGLWRWQEATGQFVQVKAVGNLPLTKIFVNKEGKVMLGCDGKGLHVYDPQYDLLVTNPIYSKDVDLSHAKVYDILEDQNSNLWLGLFQKGLFMQPATRSVFGYMGPKLGDKNMIGSNCVTSVYVDSKRRYWVGTDKDGLYLLGPDKRLIRHYTSVPSTLLTLCEDRQGRMWLGSYEQGCGWVSAESADYHPQDLGLGDQASIFSIVADGKGALWIGTMGQGLVYYDTTTQRTTHYRMSPNADAHRKTNSIANDFVGKVALSPDGKKVYAATSVGLCCLDLEQGSWVSTFGTNCLLHGTFTRVVRVSPQGDVFVGTNDGLVIVDGLTHKQRWVTTKEGLPDNGVAAIEIDRRGNVWVGTDHGLGCLHLKTGKIDCFYADKGLQSNEFSDGASFISADRQHIVLGGTGGISWFDTQHIKPQTWKATVKITALTVGNQEINVRPDSSYFKMNYEDNSFSIHLSTLTYDDPDNIDYYYSINGDDWVRLSKGNNEIAFTHLSPGTYHFKVKAMLNNIPSEERQFTVVVRSPWYGSTVARLIYLLLVAGAAYLYWQYRQRKEEDRLKLQEHIHAEELSEAKLRFFMNISHDIRTPMTLIVAPLLQLIKEDGDAHRQGIYKTIRRNADRILSLINQMMDLRKIDKGLMNMHMQETNLVTFIQDIHSLFLYQVKAKNISFGFTHDADALPVWIDRENFDKVLMNLLSNAFKFCLPGGNITIRLTHDEAMAHIAVSNDGSPISEDKLERIFERFYQMPTTAENRNMGTGIGLDLTRALVELHYGSIVAHNLEGGKGCEFVVSIPLGKAHLKPEEIVVEKEGQAEKSAAHTLAELETDEEMEGTTPENINQQLSNRGRQHIVIVEDDDEISQYLKAELESDYHVTTCPNGKVGLQHILQELPALVISDIMMPEMDGNTLCARLKTNINTNHIPVILLTAKNTEDDQLEGLETGADAYIVKPFNMDILRRTIVNMLHQRETLRNKFNGSETQTQHVEAVKIDAPDERLMERIMTVVNRNLSNSDLSVDMIANEVGISRVHLYRKLKELTNQAPHTLIRNIRLQQAAALLATSSHNISEVMYACGFSNATSFSTTFKNFYGMSPREYMKQKQQKGAGADSGEDTRGKG